MTEQKIKKQKFHSKKFERQIIEAFIQIGKPASLYDIVVHTALATEWVEYALRRLMEKYPCRLIGLPGQIILYDFDFKQNNFLFHQLKLSILHNPWLKKQKKIYRMLSSFMGENIQKKYFLEKVLLNYIRHNGGSIVIAELVQLTGWAIRTAENEIVQLMVNYNGRVEVSEEGILVYYFEELEKEDMASKEITQSLKIWERPQSEYKAELSYNISFRQVALPFSALLLCFSTLFVPQEMHTEISTTFLGISFLMLIPSFQDLYYLVKFIQYSKINQRIRNENVENYVLKAIFNRLNQQINPEKEINLILEEVKPKKNYQYWWNEKIAPFMFDVLMMLTCTYQKEALFFKKAQELEAEISEDEEGNMYFEFERLRRELEYLRKRPIRS